MNVTHLPKRASKRDSVRWPVHVHNFRTLMPRAETRDFSSAGTFIKFGDGRVAPKAGAELTMRVFIPGRGCFLDLAGTVRWVGYSKEHGCFGAGVEFDIVAAEGVAHPWAA